MSKPGRRRSAPFLSASRRAPAGTLLLAAAWMASACPSDPCCDADADCETFATCFEGSCHARCSHPSQCGDGETCVAGACVAPRRAPSTCPFEPRDAVTPPPDDEDAGPPPPAEDAGPPPPVGCELDDEEPNDTPATASFAQSGSFTICDVGDSDYFIVEVPDDGWQVRARVEFLSAEGDLDLQLLGPAPDLGRVVATSQGVGDVEEITVDPVPGNYVLHVFGFANATNSYTLSIELSPPDAPCVDDGFEDNDTRGTATDIEQGVLGGAMCPGDPDFYRLAGADIDGFLSASLTYGGDVPLRLEARAPGQGVLGVSDSGSGTETLSLPVDAGTVVTLGVTAPPDFTGARFYELAVAFTSDVGCAGDGYEPDDTADNATPVSLTLNVDEQVEAESCPTDDDHFLFSVDTTPLLWSTQLEAPDDVTAVITNRNDPNTVYAELAGDDSTFIILSPDTPEEERRALRVRVENEGGAAASYVFTIRPELSE